MNRFKFLKEGLRNIKTVGTVTRSSRYLCDKMINHSRIHKARYIMELGAGDGVLTRRILDRMPDNCKLVSFEINEKFVDILNSIQDDRLIVVGDSAENIEKHLIKHNIDELDIVYSALPFTVFPKELAKSIVELAKKKLRFEGEYLQIHYSLIAKKMYDDIFQNVQVYFQPINIPPAFVLKSLKGE
ncbi:class I SAM-dependent methyltransferase [Membranihabitans maritimus]|uniref:class I SAM-dependent methyltransferase n=1 Tax=Membranihabitans maritimus TaxID=2904244 RepID=UPI001F01B6EE|nr:rRNA adenine N-6-methyltransferase family protein [Membranihabitans maritimus]